MLPKSFNALDARGRMSLNTSPNDPLFFLHHCNVDRIWAEWQQGKSNCGYPDDGSITFDDGVRIPSHNRSDIMKPWHIPETSDSYTLETFS